MQKYKIRQHIRIYREIRSDLVKYCYYNSPVVGIKAGLRVCLAQSKKVVRFLGKLSKIKWNYCLHFCMSC